jgi:hypothetical protein
MALVRSNNDNDGKVAVLLVAHVDGMRLYLRTAATKGPVVLSPDDIAEYIHGRTLLTRKS